MRATLSSGALGPHLAGVAQDYRRERDVPLLEVQQLWRSAEGARRALCGFEAVAVRPHLLVRWHLHGTAWPVPPRFVILDRRLTIRLKAGPRCLLTLEPSRASNVHLQFVRSEDGGADPAENGPVHALADWSEPVFRRDLEAALRAYDEVAGASG